MMVEEAKTKVEEATGLKVEKIVDCGDKWVFSFKEFNNEEDNQTGKHSEESAFHITFPGAHTSALPVISPGDHSMEMI